MAADTLDQIQSNIAAVIDSDPDTSHISAADYALRKTYINKALSEYENATDWQQLHATFNMLISSATGNASIALPQDFKKPSANPIIGGVEFKITRPQDGRKYLETDPRVEFIGNPRTNYTLRIYGTTLASGASIQIPYYMSAGSLATTTDVPPMSDTSFLTQRAIAYWYEAHEDARFLTSKIDAERLLGNLIDYENTFPEGADTGRVKSVDESNSGFRFGE